MTTVSSSTPYSMATTTDLRTVGSELNGWLSTSGLVQTADTGQVNWTTVTLPAIGTLIGYEIWRFADSTIYFKLEWWTNATVNTRPATFWLTVGTGSDGAGNITGQSTGRINVQVATIGPNAGSFPTYICRTADFFGIAWKAGGPATLTPCGLSFQIEKAVDNSGAALTTAYCLTYGPNAVNGLSTKIAVRTAATAQTFTATTSFCAVPGNVSASTNAAGNKQVYLHAWPIPDVVLSNFTCTYVASEAVQATTVSTTLVGSTAHTYIALGQLMGSGNSSSAAATWGQMMLWE